MRLIKNVGNDRVIDELRRCLAPQADLDIATPLFSLFATGEAGDVLGDLAHCRIVVPAGDGADLGLLGSDADRPFRNRLQARWYAKRCAEWLQKADLRGIGAPLPQAALITRHAEPDHRRAITGNCPFTTEGLGLTPGNQFGLIQCADSPEECDRLEAWFAALWNSLPAAGGAKDRLLARLRELTEHQPPALIYFLILHHLFKDLGEEIDEERIVKSATGIRDTVVWKKLYKFQRDGVIGAIDKLERHGGCIIADSVGLGKTFEALAVIKYYELRNDRVLVLCPKRLRDNWTLYRSNDRRNVLCTDRFNYDVLNHTDLSRDGGASGDINLSFVNWGNYDLLVIDESHNFRNKPAHKEKDSRYDRLMSRIIQSGVKTRVLMLSATPVNNRLADLKNQIAFITEGADAALADHGLPSIDLTIRQAQTAFNVWQKLEEAERRPPRLIEMLGFDYFKLLDLLTIARSRKHVEKYYGTEETGTFPERLKPVNIKADVDLSGEFPAVREINDEIRRLNLSAYAPLRYVLPHKMPAYDRKYGQTIRGGEGFFRQLDREESLVHLLRVNILKRMESSVNSFALTVGRQLADVEKILTRIEAHNAAAVEELSIEDIEVDDPAFETLLAGRKVKVLLPDVDRVRWRQDLAEDRERLSSLLSAARRIDAARDAKLHELRELIQSKVAAPANPGNRKVLVFTHFADTAEYLYRELSPWALRSLGLHSALLSGTVPNRTTVPGLHLDLGAILTAFSPRSKERAVEFAGEGEIDLLFATDCVSEGQNLQDCDYVVNYDIHWNPVRIIQRFGRIDRIGSPNVSVQLVNFWPNMELEEYINLEQRVSGRMALLDISATGEENVIEFQAGNYMNDLEYRRKQLLKLQEQVIDLEDLSAGVTITDLNLSDFRIDLAGYMKQSPGRLDALPLGLFAVTTSESNGEAPIQPGVVFCLRAVGEAAKSAVEPGYPLAPHYVVHVGDDGAVLLPYTQAKQALDRLKRLCIGQDAPDVETCARFDKATRRGEDMAAVQRLLSKAVASIVGAKEERSVASLFVPGGTHALKGEFQGTNDFEVVGFLVVLPEPAAKAAGAT